jgi:Transposase, Mutator family
MAGKTPRPQATQERTLTPMLTHCPECGHRLWWDYTNDRKVAALDGVVRLWLQSRRCPNPDCRRYHRPYRPEEEGRVVLPHYEYGLDVLALLGALRYPGHGSVPEIHRRLVERGVSIGQRNVT